MSSLLYNWEALIRNENENDTYHVIIVNSRDTLIYSSQARIHTLVTYIMNLSAWLDYQYKREINSLICLTLLDDLLLYFQFVQFSKASFINKQNAKYFNIYLCTIILWFKYTYSNTYALKIVNKFYFLFVSQSFKCQFTGSIWFMNAWSK